MITTVPHEEVKRVYDAIGDALLLSDATRHSAILACLSTVGMQYAQRPLSAEELHAFTDYMSQAVMAYFVGGRVN